MGHPRIELGTNRLKAGCSTAELMTRCRWRWRLEHEAISLAQQLVSRGGGPEVIVNIFVLGHLSTTEGTEALYLGEEEVVAGSEVSHFSHEFIIGQRWGQRVV